MEADFERYYQRDLLDLWRGGMTPRKAAVLAMRLPAGAQVWIALGDDRAWTEGDHLTASVFDALQVANWQRSGAKKEDLPDRLRRPSDIKEQASKRDRLAARAAKAHAREQARAAHPTPRARDARGRFVKEG